MLRQGVTQRCRTLFVSDVHLGFRYGRRRRFLEFLQSVECESLFIVGDFIDAWRLRYGATLSDLDYRIIEQVNALARSGVAITYLTGNHDDAPPAVFEECETPVRIAERAIHLTQSGKRFCVAHGHQFDPIEMRARWLSILGMRIYDGLLGNRHVARRLWHNSSEPHSVGRERCQRAALNDDSVDQSNQSTNLRRFARRALQFASQQSFDGVICGHTHRPTIQVNPLGTYINTGDWVRNSTAVVENMDGNLELLEVDERISHRVSIPRRVHLPSRPVNIQPTPAVTHSARTVKL